MNDCLLKGMKKKQEANNVNSLIPCSATLQRP